MNIILWIFRLSSRVIVNQIQFLYYFLICFFSSSKRCCFTVNDLILERIGSERSAWFQIQRPAVGMKIIINVLFLSRCFVTIRYEQIFLQMKDYAQLIHLNYFIWNAYHVIQLHINSINKLRNILVNSNIQTFTKKCNFFQKFECPSSY